MVNELDRVDKGTRSETAARSAGGGPYTCGLDEWEVAALEADQAAFGESMPASAGV
jgi:hypothetical protein